MSAPRVPEVARPNLLVVMADQHAAHALSCAGATHLRTPALDALAAGGTRFERAYTTFPLCVPARASMMTGRHPHELGVRGNRPEPGTQSQWPPLLGHRLRDLGYDTAYAGKWHAPRPSASVEDGFEVIAPMGDRDLVDGVTTWLSGRGDATGPFALVVSLDDPHSICEYARNQPMPYGGVGEPPPVRELPPLPANHVPAAYEPEALRHEQRRAAAMYGTLEHDADDWRRYRWAYARLVERADTHVGGVLDALAAAGLAEDTVVVYTSDHGDGDASHRWNQKTALFEESCRVPLIVRDPRCAAPVPTSTALVSVGRDLLPTLLAVAGAGSDSADDGLDLTTLLDGRPGRDAVVVETAFDPADVGSSTVGRAVVTDRYKYVVYGWGAHREQLFDLLADPGEQCNLAVEAAHDSVLEEMRGRLLSWCRASEDTAFLKRLVLPADTPVQVHEEIFAIPY